MWCSDWGCLNAEKLWLTIGIPTVPRIGNTDYLTQTLSSALEELPLNPSAVLYKRVKIVVMNNRPGNHSVFDQVHHLSPVSHAANKICVDHSFTVWQNLEYTPFIPFFFSKDVVHAAVELSFWSNCSRQVEDSLMIGILKSWIRCLYLAQSCV